MHPLIASITLAVFVIQAAASPRPSGTVRVSGHAIADDRGEFPALGASLFWAAWAYKNDRPRLDTHLRLLAEHNFDYIRALGVVGRQPYWSGREIDWRWSDYDQVIAGLTDYAFDKYGLRIEWTIFGDADQMIPDRAERARLVDRFAAMAAGREQKIMHFELANESWQNGFEGAAGVEELRTLARRLDAATAVPVAISDSEGHQCADHLALYKDTGVQILTEHFPRDTSGRLGRWTHVVAPWDVRDCPGLPPVVSNNEPIGPRSSVESETDPMLVVGAAIVSWMAGVGLYVFHTEAGVWGREPLTSMPGANTILDGLSKARRYVPADIANWQRYRGASASLPFSAENGVEVLVALKGEAFFAAVVGVEGGVEIVARQPIRFETIDPLTGQAAAPRSLSQGDKALVEANRLLILRGAVSAPAK